MEPYSDPPNLPEGDAEAVGGKSVNKAYLVNKLNYVNFQDQSISICLRHHKYNNAILLQAKPLPCAGDRLDCQWALIPGLRQLLETYRFEYLLFNDGKKFLLVHPKVISMQEDALAFQLPSSCREFRMRRIKRHPCSGIGVQITQNGALFQGTLADFTPVSLRVEGGVSSPQTFKWFNLDSPVDVHIYHGKTILYSGVCNITRYSRHDTNGTFVLSVAENSIERFSRGRYSNSPQHLVPSPNIVFQHPLIGKTVSLNLCDIFGSGFSVEESEEDSVLMPGMMIPSLKLTFGHHLDIACKAQVVSRKIGGEEDGKVARCAVSILDMDIHEHVKLLSILHKVSDRNAYLCNTVDLDALWDFFFETGFIYPEKYAHFQTNKEKIKKTYQKLYSNNPHIARHFIYQDKGSILGHIAMVRFFKSSWMIHHHAARKKMSLKAGLTVLQQISHYINVLQNFHFAHLNYIYCYYRPENKFPNRIFGGFARQLNDQKSCSHDKFAFFHFLGKEVQEERLDPPWEVKEACEFDVRELNSFYGYASGGLMIDAFDLRPEQAEQDCMAQHYQKLGFKKEKRTFALTWEGNIKAFILANCTDAGFNMADLTNCATLVLLDENVPPEVTRQALKQVSGHYENEEMPVLTFPHSYMEKHSLPYNKIYMLWIMSLHCSDAYFEYCDSIFRAINRSSSAEAALAEE